jgi:PhnB protein
MVMLKDTLPFAVYLVFNGNCRQAFNYYQTCFGGELTLQTLADTPHGIEMSKEMQRVVIYATLKNEYFKLVGSDLMDEGRIVSGNNVSILIECSSLTERSRLINKLVGRNFCSIKNNNPLINVTDKYSINWILSVS